MKTGETIKNLQKENVDISSMIFGGRQTLKATVKGVPARKRWIGVIAGFCSDRNMNLVEYKVKEVGELY